MSKKLLLVGLVVVMAAATAWWVRSAPDAPGAEASSNDAASSWWQALPESPAAKEMPASQGEQGMSPQEMARWQKTYEELSPQEQALVQQTRAYENFMGRMHDLLDTNTPRSLNPAEAQMVMAEIDRFQREDYYSLNHALQLKTAIARMAFQGAELDARLAEMQKQFELEYAELLQRSDPTKDPVYIAFKAEETAMIDQARGMSSFPDGLTRDQYIIRESEKIRARHYPD